MKYLRSMPLLFICVLSAAIILAILKIFGARVARQNLQTIIYKAAVKIWRIKITQIGELAPAPAMLVSNHCSYVDVAILGSIGEMRFTPKSEVRNWFLIGRVTRAFDVIFVDRSPNKSQATAQSLQTAMQQGGRLCIFPEGTTNNGRELKPFKSSMFSLVAGTPITLQPIVIKYRRVDGALLNSQTWDRIAWFGDAAFLPHMWHLGRFRNIEVEVHCLPTIDAEQLNRKQLSQQAEQMIKNVLMQ